MDSPSNRPRLGSFDQRLADFDTFSPGPSQSTGHSLWAAADGPAGGRWTYADALYKDPGATLDDLREVVANLEEIERTMRRVLGNAHPHVRQVVAFLRDAQATLRAHETPGST